MLEKFIKPMGRTHCGEVCGGLSPVRETPKSVRGPPPEEEGTAGTSWDEPTASSCYAGKR